jgi:hypothetical protein
VYSKRTQYVLAQEIVGTLDKELPCTKHMLAQFRELCPQCKGKKIRINKIITGHDKRVWVRVREKGKNKERCVNRVMFLTKALSVSMDCIIY